MIIAYRIEYHLHSCLTRGNINRARLSDFISFFFLRGRAKVRYDLE